MPRLYGLSRTNPPTGSQRRANGQKPLLRVVHRRVERVEHGLVGGRLVRVELHELRALLLRAGERGDVQVGEAAVHQLGREEGELADAEVGGGLVLHGAVELDQADGVALGGGDSLAEERLEVLHLARLAVARSSNLTPEGIAVVVESIDGYRFQRYRLLTLEGKHAANSLYD